VLTQGRADGRGRGRLSADRLQLDLCEDFLCHYALDLLDLVEADLDRSLTAED
jgi:hypothetical protein